MLKAEYFAPITGAWIETLSLVGCGEKTNSHPSRVRGLKHPIPQVASNMVFAPITGAWIETIGIIDTVTQRFRTHHGCVD